MHFKKFRPEWLHLPAWPLLFLLVSAKSTGCHPAASDPMPATQPGAVPGLSTAALVQKLPHQHLKQFTTMTAKSQILVENDGQSMSANANIIWIRDSIVWINIKKFGLEVARALITRDSVFLLNRVEHTCTARGLDFLKQQYNLPEGFALLQETLLANAWMFPDVVLQSGTEDGLHQLQGSNDQYAVKYGMQDGDYLLKKEVFIQKKDSRLLSMGFENYKKLSGGSVFPYLRHVESYTPESGNMQFTMEFSDVNWNAPGTYRFEIPSYYEKK
jgi:hypothetical protein